MSRLGRFCDEHYINMNLYTELELPTARDASLHFFEQMRKACPGLRNLHARDKGETALEEDKDSGSYRWVVMEPKRLSSGWVSPPNNEAAMEFHTTVLDIASYALSVSSLDCDSLNIMHGFDYAYRGNHNQLVLDALGISPALEKLSTLPQAHMLGCEPSIQIALDDDCRTQARLSVETRTSAFHVRTRQFPEEQLSVYLTVRRYGTLKDGDTYAMAIQRLGELCSDMVDTYVVENVLLPLQQAIALR